MKCSFLLILEQFSASSGWAGSLPCGNSEIQVSSALWSCPALRLGVPCTWPVARQRENGKGTPTFKAPKAASDTLIPDGFHCQELAAWCHSYAKVLGNSVSTGQAPSNHNFPVRKRPNKCRRAVSPPCHALHSLPTSLPQSPSIKTLASDHRMGRGERVGGLWGRSEL